MALLLAQARNVPQAHAALIAGRWERTRWEGVELADKTLAIIGLGRIGKLVADRAKAFGMRLVAYDPFVSADRARQMGVELLTLDQAVAEADFLTIHLPKTKETTGLINRDLLLKAKPSLRVINVARGGIVDEQALADCVRDGIIAGAAIDVFATEPTTSSPLFELDSIVVTPHLGASTREAQDKAGDTIADMVQLALAGDFVPFAVNVDAAEANETLRPFLPLAERLGRLFASLVASSAEPPATLEVCTEGDIAGYDTRILSLAALKGFFGAITDEQVTYVNAPQLAKQSGIEVRDTNCATSADFVNLVTLRGGGHSLSGTLVGRRSEQRIVMIDDHHFDVPPAEHMLMVKNDDRPGVIGTVGTLLGNAGVNIDDMDVGRAAVPGTAVMLIAPSAAVTPDGDRPSCARPPASSASSPSPPDRRTQLVPRARGLAARCASRVAIGFGAGGVGEVGAVRGVEHGSRRVDDHAEAGAVGAGCDGGLDVAALRAHAGHQQRQVADDGPHLPQLVGVGGTDHEAAVADVVPLVGHSPGDVGVQRLAVDHQRLEVAAARVAGAAQHEHATVGVAQERLDRVGAQVRVHGDDVGAVAVERFAGVLLGGAADVAALGVEHQQHVGMAVADVRAQPLELGLGADGGEVGDLRLERAHQRRPWHRRWPRRSRTPSRARRRGTAPGRGRDPHRASSPTHAQARRSWAWKAMHPTLLSGAADRCGRGGAVGGPGLALAWRERERPEQGEPDDQLDDRPAPSTAAPCCCGRCRPGSRARCP